MTESKIQLERLLATHYVHPDLSKAHTFFDDFGFIIARRDENKVYYRGFGPDPYLYVAEQSPDGSKSFVGGIWTVASRDVLERAEGVSGASKITTSDAPGGGECVVLKDPNGATVTLVHGIDLRHGEAQEKEKPDAVILNTWEDKPRKGETQRPKAGPSNVHKLGHYGVKVEQSQYDETLAWYLNTFNLTLTDSLYNPGTGKDLMAFAHVDLGERFTDHHSFFVHVSREPLSGPSAHHSSYEVDNFDSELTGHDHLLKKGWKACWGVGRHLLGSQIFDYWFDASGFIIEHYSDGDLVNHNTKATREPVAAGKMALWGPQPSRAFLTGRMEDLEQVPTMEEVRKAAVAG